MGFTYNTASGKGKEERGDLHCLVTCNITTMNQAPAAGRNPAAAAAAAPVIIIREPLETDVILGRGSAHAWRPANVAFHRLLDQYAPRYYAETSTKKLKTSMIQDIYIQMAARGRFLTKAKATADDDDDNASEGFVSLRESDAKARISDAMRYRQRRRKNAAKTAPATAPAALVETVAIAPAAAAARQQPSVPEEEDEEEEEQKKPAFNEQQQQQQPAEQLLMPPPLPVIQNIVVGQQDDHSEDEVEIISDTDLSSVLD